MTTALVHCRSLSDSFGTLNSKLNQTGCHTRLSQLRANSLVPHSLESKLGGRAEVGVTPNVNGMDTVPTLNSLVTVKLDLTKRRPNNWFNFGCHWTSSWKWSRFVAGWEAGSHQQHTMGGACTRLMEKLTPLSKNLSEMLGGSKDVLRFLVAKMNTAVGWAAAHAKAVNVGSQGLTTMFPHQAWEAPKWSA